MRKKSEKMEHSPRNKEIYILRESGARFSEIARNFSISPSRAKQIYLREKEKINKKNRPQSFKNLLSNRAINALVNRFNDQEIINTPEIIITFGADEIRKIQNIGKLTILEIANALCLLGYIKKNDSTWFK